MANKILLTEYFKTHMARQLIQCISGQTNNAYYMFAGKHTEFPDGDTTVIQPENTRQSLYIDTYENMLFGKKITENDIKFMIPRNTWTSGTVYSMYQHDDANLFNEDFFVVADEGSNYHVFKCLDNNGGTPSTIKPSDTNPTTPFYQTSDGYQWKYMYTVDSTTFNKFSTIDYMPVVENANVVANAVSGAIDVITVTAGGAGYDNYIDGQFNSTDIRIAGNNLAYGISANASSTNGFYTDCYLYITGSGAGNGEYKRIVNYINDGTHKKVIVESPFTATINSTSTYAISPIVQITGDGDQTVNCVARALINAASSNSIYRVEIIDRGADYRIATATALYSNVVPVSNTASMKVIIGPKGGHGSDVVNELGANRVGFSVKFSNTESGTIQANNEFRTAGILKNPEFTNVYLDFSSSNGTFLVGETAYQYNPIELSGTVSVSTTANTVTGTGTTFDTQVKAGDHILLAAGGTNYFAVVDTVTSNTSLRLTANAGFTNTAATFALVNTTAQGVVSSAPTGAIELTNVSGVFESGKTVFGINSSATGTIDTIEINGVQKGFTTFNQMIVFEGVQTGTFTPNETVTQENGGSAKLHSINSGKMYVTNQIGIINVGDSVIGASGSFAITAKYPGDIVVDSGDVIYVENFPAIERASDRSETIKVIVEF